MIWPTGPFPCILADPPWRFRVWSRRGLGRSAERYYPTLTIEDIKAFPVGDIAAPDAFLFLWCTGPFIALGHHVDVIRAWGFEPSGIMFTWAKLNRNAVPPYTTNSFWMGMGYNSRHNVEICFLGRRGSPQRKSYGVRELIVAPLREHSRKPIEAHQRIEDFCLGPRLELFAREQPATRHSDQWTVFGDQIEAGFAGPKRKRRP